MKRSKKCKNCTFCIDFWNGLVKRHYCQMKVQKYHDDIRKVTCKLTDTCEHFSERYY